MADNLYDFDNNGLARAYKDCKWHFLTDAETKLASVIPTLKNGVKVFTK